MFVTTAATFVVRYRRRYPLLLLVVGTIHTIKGMGTSGTFSPPPPQGMKDHHRSIDDGNFHLPPLLRTILLPETTIIIMIANMIMIIL